MKNQIMSIFTDAKDFLKFLLYGSSLSTKEIEEDYLPQERVVAERVVFTRVTRAIDSLSSTHYLDAIDHNGWHWTAQMSQNEYGELIYTKDWNLSREQPLVYTNSDIKNEDWTFYTLHCTKDFMDEVDNMAARENITREDIIRRAVGLYHIAQSEEAKGNLLSFVNKETNNIEESIKL